MRRPVTSGERVIGERPVSREELAESGNLLQGPAQELPYREERSMLMRSSECVERAMPIRQALPMSTTRLETVQAYTVPPVVERVQTYAAPAVMSAPIVTAPAIQTAQVVQTAPVMQAVQASPVVQTYAAAPATTYAATTYAAPLATTYAAAPQTSGTLYTSAPRCAAASIFDLLDRNHDGVIDRAEFNALSRSRAGRYVV